MRKKSVRDIDVKDKRVRVREDFNFPLNGDEITDDTRIQKVLPTIKHLILEDIAVTILQLQGISKPGDMTGETLINGKGTHLLRRYVPDYKL